MDGNEEMIVKKLINEFSGKKVSFEFIKCRMDLELRQIFKPKKNNLIDYNKKVEVMATPIAERIQTALKNLATAA